MTNTNSGNLTKIINILKSRIGRENAITLREMSDRIGYHGWDDSYRQLRRWIKQIIEEQKIPIGSCNRGYYVFKDDQEMWDYIWRLDDQQRAIQSRIDMVFKAMGEPTKRRRAC